MRLYMRVVCMNPELKYSKIYSAIHLFRSYDEAGETIFLDI